MSDLIAFDRGKIVNVPIDRIAAKVEFEGGFWHEFAYQGPGGCYAIRETDAPATAQYLSVFQVYRVRRDKDELTTISEPFLTSAGARQFAARLAAGGDSSKRFD